MRATFPRVLAGAASFAGTVVYNYLKNMGVRITPQEVQQLVRTMGQEQVLRAIGAPVAQVVPTFMQQVDRIVPSFSFVGGAGFTMLATLILQKLTEKHNIQVTPEGLANFKNHIEQTYQNSITSASITNGMGQPNIGNMKPISEDQMQRAMSSSAELVTTKIKKEDNTYTIPLEGRMSVLSNGSINSVFPVANNKIIQTNKQAELNSFLDSYIPTITNNIVTNYGQLNDNSMDTSAEQQGRFQNKNLELAIWDDIIPEDEDSEILKNAFPFDIPRIAAKYFNDKFKPLVARVVESTETNFEYRKQAAQELYDKLGLPEFDLWTITTLALPLLARWFVKKGTKVLSGRYFGQSDRELDEFRRAVLNDEQDPQFYSNLLIRSQEARAAGQRVEQIGESIEKGLTYAEYAVGGYQFLDAIMTPELKTAVKNWKDKITDNVNIGFKKLSGFITQFLKGGVDGDSEKAVIVKSIIENATITDEQKAKLSNRIDAVVPIVKQAEPMDQEDIPERTSDKSQILNNVPTSIITQGLAFGAKILNNAINEIGFSFAADKPIGDLSNKIVADSTTLNTDNAKREDGYSTNPQDVNNRKIDEIKKTTFRESIQSDYPDLYENLVQKLTSLADQGAAVALIGAELYSNYQEFLEMQKHHMVGDNPEFGGGPKINNIPNIPIPPNIPNNDIKLTPSDIPAPIGDKIWVEIFKNFERLYAPYINSSYKMNELASLSANMIMVKPLTMVLKKPRGYLKDYNAVNTTLPNIWGPLNLKNRPPKFLRSRFDTLIILKNVLQERIEPRSVQVDVPKIEGKPIQEGIPAMAAGTGTGTKRLQEEAGGETNLSKRLKLVESGLKVVGAGISAAREFSKFKQENFGKYTGFWGVGPEGL